MHEGQLRLEKIGENHIKHVVRGLCKGSKRISIIGSIYVATILRALKLGLDAVARRLWCVCAINSEFFCFFQHRILFCLNWNLFFCHVIRGTRRSTKQNANGTVHHDL